MIGPIECQTIDEMKSVMDINFFGLVRLLKEILPDMKKRKSGHIVVISSVMGIQGELLKMDYNQLLLMTGFLKLIFAFELFIPGGERSNLDT